MRKPRVIVAVVAVLALGIVAALLLRPEDRQVGDAPPAIHEMTSDPVERGRQLVTLGDCHGCHTVRGGAPFAGGRAIPTPFGTFYSPNITPDATTGIGGWTAEDFWHALHNGYSRDGTLLYPTFPYTNYTKVSRRDADAMFAYLQSLPPVAHKNYPHALRFPYNIRALLVAWRWLFFRPGVYEADPGRSREWNRGAYLVQGLEHCSACHEARNALGAIRSKSNPSGGLVLSWYAPSLSSPQEAGVHDWSDGQIVRLLQTGESEAAPGSARRATALGPMAEVVYDSLQHVGEDDLRAMATYLKSLPVSESPASGTVADLPASASYETLVSGREVYEKQCASCHGDNGEGKPPAGPALAGNRAVTMAVATNPIRIALFGGYPPGTTGNPRPFGMPPFYPSLRDDQIADVLSYVRRSWGNSARPVSGSEVAENRGNPLW